MRVEEIEIHVGRTTFPFRRIRELEARCEAVRPMSPAPTVKDANARLRQMAAAVGANAAVEVSYDFGASLTSRRTLRARGTAGTKASDEIACPSCAEPIKRAGQQVPLIVQGSRYAGRIRIRRPFALRLCDNPGRWLGIVVAVILGPFAIIGALTRSPAY